MDVAASIELGEVCCAVAGDPVVLALGLLLRLCTPRYATPDNGARRKVCNKYTPGEAVVGLLLDGVVSGG